ncbi:MULTISPECIES: hypothetical protein [Pseudonocardia]|uniref:hypothetical protein n=1 Tax=Pseudonocardia TaxID=1847 RepID=UPI000F78E8DD|nr:MULTISPECIES: hypothetical protein [Pseudonocardia]
MTIDDGHRERRGARPVVEPTGRAWRPVAAELFRRQPGAVRRLLAEHVDDGTGHCKKCWSQHGNPRHPCNVRLFALDGCGPAAAHRRSL